ncbi:MAG: hypothetical protein M9933_18845 [Chitinophagaceae bacterium]|nr:hypothetical protein [Chitinophagaceae bacterium]
MYSIIRQAHSGIAYLLLAALIVSVIYALASRKKTFTAGGRKIALTGLIFAHLQLLLGLILYFISPLGVSNFSGEAMKDRLSRLYVMEHPLTMIIAIILITIGYSRIKKQTTDRKKYNSMIIYYGIALILALAVIPWMVWP